MGFTEGSPPPFCIACPLPVCLPKKTHLRSKDATPQTCSAPVVLPDFGGLLHAMPRKFVAPCFRPWGSPCFPLTLPKQSSRFPKALYPFKAFPSLAAPLHVTGLRRSPRSDSLSPLLLALRLVAATPLHVATSCCHLVVPGFHLLDLRAFFRQKVRCSSSVLPP